MAYKTKALLTSKLFALAGLALGITLTAASAFAQMKYYRYVNEDGIRVISHNIPPEQAQKGYEIMTQTGQVLEVVPPAPDPQDLQAESEKRAAERELLAAYKVLDRRYSSVEDIYAARDRRLAHLDATISILRSNLGNLDGQIDDLTHKAADAERSGREVPPRILSNLEEIKAERTTTEAKLQTRIEEHAGIHAEYEADVMLFNEGRALEALNSTTNARKDP